MEQSTAKFVTLSVSTILLSTIISVILFTVSMGFSIATSFQEKAISLYSDIGASQMIDASNLDTVDAINLYKVLDTNRNNILDYSIKNLDGTQVKDLKELLNRPTDTFKVRITGDTSIGFQVEVQEVSY